MKIIINFLLTLAFICCTTPQVEANVYGQLVSEVAKINDKKISPLLREMAFNFVEKKIEGEIKKNKKRQKNCLEEVEWYQNHLREMASDSNHWYENYSPEELEDQRIRYEENIQDYLGKIPVYDEKILKYEQLLTEIQLMK